MADRRRKSTAGSATSDTADAGMSTGPAMGRSTKERKPPKKQKERWLLTRKTWRYMTDAGRKLIPEGALNRPEDVPKIEAYFQEVCQKEPRFLLWRKGSYPGALTFRSHRRRKERRKGGSCRTKASSADEADEIKKATRPSDLAILHHSSGGRFDIHKLKYDFLNKPSPPSPNKPQQTGRNWDSLSTTKEEDEDAEDDAQLLKMLEKFLTISDEGSTSTAAVDRSSFNYQELIDRLHRHFSSTAAQSSSRAPIASSSRKPMTEGVRFEGDHVQKSLSETLSRYFGRSPKRDHIITNLLTDRKLLEKLYYDLRKTKGFRNTRVSAFGSPTLSHWRSSLHQSEKYDADDDDDGGHTDSWKNLTKTRFKNDSGQLSPPPLIEIEGEPEEKGPTYSHGGTQTDPIPEGVLHFCEEEYKKMMKEKEEEMKECAKPGYRRRSSVDNDDVSQSVSDTIKRYLRMARKKSGDSEKADRFKRVNYDRNLRNIKAKGEITKPGDDDGLSKGCQTNDDWILTYKETEIVVSDSETPFGSRITSSRSSYDAATGDEVALPTKISSCPSSPPSSFLSSSQSFFSHLLHGKHDKNAAAVAAASGTCAPPVTAHAAAAMQKSKSSSSVMHHGSRLVAKKIFRSRSKSQSRVQATPSLWTPQGGCVWTNVTGRQVSLTDTNLLQLSDIERRVLQKVALAKLQALNLGVTIRVPSETVGQVVNKSKRRAYLLKRKAKTTGFFDTGRKDDKDKDGNSTGGLVFGIPINQCIENDRLSRIARGGSPFRSRGELSSDENSNLRRQSRHGSRSSFSSLIDSPRTEESGSCESLMSRERIAGSVPGLLDTLSCGSTVDIASATAIEEEPGVPNMVTACLRYLENRGLHTLGIFRVSSSKKRVRQLREDFDCGKETSLDEEQCPHDVATLLKEYLRDLPDPLLCRDLYHAFVQTQRIRNRRLQLEAVQHLIQLLPVPNRDTLSALLTFLATVAKNSNDTKDASGEWLTGNKMDSNNLATVFAPNILHCIKPGSGSKDLNVDRPEDRIDVINVIRLMIDHQRQLFAVPAELLDEVYIHMMDSFPDALDKLLSKRDSTPITDELLDDAESESTSAPWTPTTVTEMSLDPVILSLQATGEYEASQATTEPRRTWSREEFLHENAGTGGPNLAMRLRHRDRERPRERSSKKRWRDDSASRKKSEEPTTNISPALTIIHRFRGQKDEDIASTVTKVRSSSVDNTAPYEGNDVNARLLRLVGEDHHAVDRRQSSPLLLDNSGVITASLKIPVQAGNQPMSLNLDDSDIPYIEDGCLMEGSKQQMTIGLVRGPSAPPRRRQRSGSGSDSSQASIQPITGSISVKQGYDSALGSSATYSSPPQNTTPSSIGSSYAGDASVYSSPPSWASTPPTSPDSTHTSVNYIPDDAMPGRVTRVPVTIQKLQIDTNAKDSTSPILQKVSFTSTSELQQVKQPKQIEIQYQKEITKKQDLPKSASTSAVATNKADVPQPVKEQKVTTSISSIGGAVLRSKTADFERMLRLGKTTEVKSKTTTTTTTTTSSEKKKYTKRRYTDTRHETRHIPDSEQLEKSTSSSSSKDKSASQQGQTVVAQPGPVYKRRELIASVPKDRHSVL